MAVKGLLYVSVLRAFRQVKSKCLGMELEDGWQQSIHEFTVAYRGLENVSVTPKVHLIMHHLKDFFMLKGGKEGKLLQNISYSNYIMNDIILL